MCITFRPRNHRHSATWDRFEIVYYRNIRQNFAKCFSCNSIVSYKKTTGTASLIRHKCKNSQLSNNCKNDSLGNLLVVPAASSSSVLPPPLTPAPQFSRDKQKTTSASSSSVSSSTNAIINHVKLDGQQTTRVRPRSEYLMNSTEKELINAQIQWLSQCLISTEILGDSSYLEFLQQLINYGADHGKQIVTNFINRDVILNELIPKKRSSFQAELIKELKDTEFSISYSTWTNYRAENYVTVFVYYFTQAFEYKNAILGTKRYDNDSDVVNIVKEIVKTYKNVSCNLLRCVSEQESSHFEVYPCVISRISKVILTAMNANDDNKMFFKKIYQKAHEILSIPQKSTFEQSTDDSKMKIFYTLFQYVKNNEMPNNAIIKKFKNLLSPLFSAIMSLMESTDDDMRCITANQVYLWCKKFLKYYTDFTCSDDKVVKNIGLLILNLIKENFSDKIHELYQIAVFLNPNFKSLKFLTTNERTNLIAAIKKNLEKLMNEDSCHNESQPPPAKKQKSTTTTKNQTHLSDTFLEFMDITMESVDDQVNSEIQRYMGFKIENLIDIVEFWSSNDSFPYLKRLARNYLNVPACTFHSNCCFLSNENEFYQKCKSLSAPDDIENLTFLHQNLFLKKTSRDRQHST